MTNKMAIPRHAAVARIKRVWPDADEIRHETDKCPDCKRQDTLWSFQLPSDGPRGTSEETCTYWCSACSFSNAGSRKSIDTDTEKKDG